MKFMKMIQLFYMHGGLICSNTLSFKIKGRLKTNSAQAPSLNNLKTL